MVQYRINPTSLQESVVGYDSFEMNVNMLSYFNRICTSQVSQVTSDF